jgi:hypothetical protein
MLLPPGVRSNAIRPSRSGFFDGTSPHPFWFPFDTSFSLRRYIFQPRAVMHTCSIDTGSPLTGIRPQQGHKWAWCTVLNPQNTYWRDISCMYCAHVPCTPSLRGPCILVFRAVFCLKRVSQPSSPILSLQ